MTSQQTNRREHIHRRPRKKDFEGKTVLRFVRTADNIWKLRFTDGTAFAIQCEVDGMVGVPYMGLCDVCVDAA